MRPHLLQLGAPTLRWAPSPAQQAQLQQAAGQRVHCVGLPAWKLAATLAVASAARVTADYSAGKAGMAGSKAVTNAPSVTLERPVRPVSGDRTLVY